MIGAALTALTAHALGVWAKIPALSTEQWERVFTMACHQNVAALVADHVADAPLAVRLKFAAAKEKESARFDRYCNAVAKLLAFFNSHGIDTMLLKGIDICRHYPQPSLRHTSDIDIYQFGRHKEADALVSKELHKHIDNRSLHHSKYSVDGILVENHYEIVSHHVSRDGKRMDAVLRTLADAAPLPFTVGGQRCLLPQPAFTALFLMRHAAAHFAADRVTLRHLTDWVLFCRAEGDNIDWEMVRDTATRFGFLPFAEGFESICQSHFGHTPRIGTRNDIATRMLNEMLDERTERDVPSPSQIMKRLAFKHKRFHAAKWKYELCASSTPWRAVVWHHYVSKVVKPHTILH